MNGILVKKLSGAHTRFALAALAVILFAGTAYAETWYLMAADVKTISQPQAASMMIKGAVAGPIRFTSQGSFGSRAQCETERNKLAQDWQKHSIIARGGWSQHGFTSPNAFARCVPDHDPRLSTSNGATPTMDVMLQTRRVRGH
ncbi:MAG TPA: hypothetical protein VKB84_19060 [Candidatus Binataceae bacterium]|nr:hypothetical protein [Candidatus Binataceae bacterium]